MSRHSFLLSIPLLVAGCSEDEFFVPTPAEPTAASGSTMGSGAAAGAAGESSSDAAGGSGGGSGGEASSLEPLLNDLVVEGVRIGLKPAFSPERELYSVLAEPEPGDLTVLPSADERLAITIEGEPAQSGESVVLSNVDPGNEIEVMVENPVGDQRVYQLRYLPPDFPDIDITISEPGASQDPIYVAMRRSQVYYLAKIDHQGVPLFYQKSETPIFDFKRHPGGEFSFAQRTTVAGISQQVVLDKDFQEVERVETVDRFSTDEHEFHILPNGNYIVLAYERTPHDLTEFGRSSNQTIVDAIVQEVSPSRELLFEWNSWDHMIYGESQYLERNAQDYSHINSVDVLPDGNWLLSSRGMSQLLKVDRDTGEVIWRLGGVQNEFTFIDDPFGGLCGQHTARWVGNGRILLFDNGQYCWPVVEERGEFTRIVEYEVDESEKTARLVWSFHRDGAYTHTQGSSQRLPNGNTFIGWGGGPTQMATEVDPDGNIVFEFVAQGIDGPFANYRAYRFPD